MEQKQITSVLCGLNSLLPLSSFFYLLPARCSMSYALYFVWAACTLGLFFTDFSKAFDSVDFNILLDKLFKYFNFFNPFIPLSYLTLWTHLRNTSSMVVQAIPIEEMPRADFFSSKAANRAGNGLVSCVGSVYVIWELCVLCRLASGTWDWIRSVIADTRMSSDVRNVSW